MSSVLPSAATTILRHEADLYGGVVVIPDNLPEDQQTFKHQLEASLQAWTTQAIKGVWLQLPSPLAHLVPEAISQGFTYHHAEQQYVMLTHWLSPLPSSLPPHASHQVGVGACVLNPHGEILVVKEKHGPAAKYDIWKVPTGLLDRGEDFSDAAVREVKEETGVDVAFEGLLSLRQAHGLAFGKSDLFCLCALSLTPASLRSATDKRPTLTPCKKEIAEAKWMPMETFTQQEFVRSRPVMQALAECMREYSRGHYKGFAVRKLAAAQLVAEGVSSLPQQVEDHMPSGWENA